MTTAATANPRLRATRGLAVLAGLAPLLCLPGGYDAANLPQSAWIVVGAWVWTAWLAARHGHALTPRPPVLLVAALSWAGLTLLWAGGRQPGLSLGLHWLACALVFVAARALWRSPREARPVFVAVTAAAALVALIGLAQAYAGLRVLPQGAPPSATFVNKNVAAGFVVLSWPFALVLLRGRCAAPAALALLLQGAFCWRAFSRSAWLALGAQLALVLGWLAWHASRRARLRLLAALLLAAAALAPAARHVDPVGETLRHLAVPRQVWDETPSDDMRVLSGRGRLAMWANTLAMLRERPLLGFGLGGHARAYPPYAYAVRSDPFFSARFQLDYVHNDYLQTAAEQGLVGLALAGACLALAVSGLRAAWRRFGGDERRYVQVAALVLVGLGVDATFSFPLERALPPLLLALAGAAAGACGARPGREPRAARGAALVALALAAGQGALFARALATDRELARMFAAWQRGDPVSARRAGERAAALDPRAFEPAFVLGRLSVDEGRPGDAVAWLTRALEQRPHDAPTLGTRAEAWGLAGEAARATEDALRAARLLPRDARAQYEAGRRLERVGRVEEARQAYARACGLVPDRADYQLRLAVSAWRAGQRVQALAAGRAALALDPRLALAHKLLGLALLDDPARRAEALEHLREALALDPRISDAERLRRVLDGERRGRATPSAGPRSDPGARP